MLDAAPPWRLALILRRTCAVAADTVSAAVAGQASTKTIPVPFESTDVRKTVLPVPIPAMRASARTASAFAGPVTPSLRCTAFQRPSPVRPAA